MPYTQLKRSKTRSTAPAEATVVPLLLLKRIIKEWIRRTVSEDRLSHHVEILGGWAERR